MATSTNQSKEILGSHPNTICQVFHAPCYSTNACPYHYQPRHQPVLHAFATANSIDTGEQVCYPNSTTASHIMPDVSMLLSKSPHSGPNLVKVGSGTLLPISNIGHSAIPNPVKPLQLRHILHVP